jgi:hypothetical protein
LKHRLKKLSAAQRKIDDRIFGKNGLHRFIAYVCVEILEIP